MCSSFMLSQIWSRNTLLTKCLQTQITEIQRETCRRDSVVAKNQCCEQLCIKLPSIPVRASQAFQCSPCKANMRHGSRIHKRHKHQFFYVSLWKSSSRYSESTVPVLRQVWGNCLCCLQWPPCPPIVQGSVRKASYPNRPSLLQQLWASPPPLLWVSLPPPTAAAKH